VTALLVLDCIAKSYRGRRVLTAASLSAAAGEVRALLGRNGVGKSSMLKVAAGLISPDGGTYDSPVRS
jgi:ABC-type sugar transport system ATPase subunit